MNFGICEASPLLHYSESKEVQSRNLEITVNNQEGIVRIAMANTVKGTCLLKITNSDGEVVYEKEVRMWDGSTVVDLEQSELGRGTFSVQIILGKESFAGRFEIK